MDEFAIRNAAPNPTPPSDLNLESFDRNIILLQGLKNMLREFNRMFTITMNTNSVRFDGDLFA